MFIEMKKEFEISAKRNKVNAEMPERILSTAKDRKQ